MAKKNKFRNADVEFFNEFNFDLNEWVKALTVKLAKEVNKKAGDYLLKIVKKRFAEEKGPRYRWKRLRPVTIAFKKGRGKILRFTRALYQSLRSTVYGGELTVTANVPHAMIHQRGATFLTTPKQSYWMWHNLFGRKGHPFNPRRITIPARPFLGFSDKEVKGVREIIFRIVKKSERMGKYGLR